jgi:hypothetical protein
MRKYTFIACVFLGTLSLFGQSGDWQSFTDSIQSLSSPRAEDLNGDGIKDIVVGGGRDGFFSNNGIMAFNGANGNLLWKRPSRNEVFGSAIFKDINNDGIRDVFITGRQAQLLAINGANGNLIWDYFPYPTNPADSGLYNFYNPQFIQDVNGDLVPDILVANGGDHNAPAWQTNRPPGHLMVINSVTGALLAKAVMPDSAETYCSAIVADIQNNGTQWILYGTGGENLGGSFYACPLNDLIQSNSLSNSLVLASDPNSGYIAPASVLKTASGGYDIIIQSFGGVVTRIKGGNFSTNWTATFPGTESSAAPVIGQFTPDTNPDVLVLLYKGVAPSYTDFYQVMLNGSSGAIEFIDSMATFSYPSANAVDLDNNGIDEAIFSLTYSENGVYKHRLRTIDFINNTNTQLDITRNGVNLGCTPLLANLDNDNTLELVYVVKKDSTNPVGNKGIFVNSVNLNQLVPNNGIAWGSYMGTQWNGRYYFGPVNCGTNSIVQAVNISQPTCNGLADGSIAPVLFGNSGPYTYVWTNESLQLNQTNLPAGTYTVLITNALNCYEERTVYLNDPYVISFGGIAPPTCPGGNNGTATLNSTGCYCMFSTCTFLWENGGITKPNYNLVEGWNSVAITHAGGCIVVDSVFIPSPSQVIDSALVLAATCYGENTGSIQVYPSQVGGQISYNWDNGQNTSILPNLSSGLYTLIVQDSRPCIDTITYYVGQPDSLIMGVTVQHVLCHGDSTGSIFTSGNGGTAPYSLWSNGSAMPANDLSGLSAGIYSLQLSDATGCVSAPINMNVNEPTPLTNSMNVTAATGITALDGTATASVLGGIPPYSYLWNDSNNQTDSLAVYLNPGMYIVSITDANGCQLQDSIYIGALGLTESNQQEAVLFPNPTSHKQVLLVPEKWLGGELFLYSSDGKMLRSWLIDTTQLTLDHQELENGTYYLSFEDATTLSFIKLR